MPNWKKLITSGSSGSLANLAVDNAITASTLNVTLTGSFSRVEADSIDLDRLSLTSTQTTVPPLQLTANSLQDGVGALRIDGSQADIFLNPSTATHTTVTFAVNDDQRLAFGMDNTSDFYITRRTGGTWYDDTFVLDRDTGLVSLGYGISVTGGITGSLLSTNGVLSSSAQIASDISGSITSTSSSIATDIASLVSFSSSLETTIYDYTGSFTGDGSGLTNVTTTVSELTTKEDTFSSATTHSVAHTFGTKNLNITVFDENDDIFIPVRINTPTTSSVVLYMEPASTGRVVISKGGHIVTGSIQIASSSVVSDTFTSATTHSVAHTFGTKDVIVSVYDNNDDVFIPARINTPTTSSVVIYMEPATTGRVVIGKAGHIVSGSAQVNTVTYANVTGKPTLISSSAQIATNISGSFTLTSASLASRITTAESELGNTLISSSAQIASNISGSFTLASASIASDIANISTDFGSITNNPFTSGSGTTITASGHFVPSANETYDLGSNTLRWKDLYLSGSTIYLGGTTLSTDNIFTKAAISGSFTTLSSSLASRAIANEKRVVRKTGNVSTAIQGLGLGVAADNPTTSSFVFYDDDILVNPGGAGGGLIFSGGAATTLALYDDDILVNPGPGGGLIFSGGAFVADYLGGVTGSSFTGSFVGSGVALTNVTASVITDNQAGGSLSFWQGSQAQYDALGSYDSNTIYFVT